MEITAAVLNAPSRQFDIEDIELDTALHSDEVLVHIVATGLCHTDISVMDQHLPFPIPAVLGHEGAGIVQQVGKNVTKVNVGDKVILAPASCGKCTYCRSGHPSYCSEFYPLNIGGARPDGSCPYHKHDGTQIGAMFFGQSSFATYSICNENNIVKVGDQDVPLEILGPLGCGLQTGAGAVLNVLRPKAGESISVFGVGPVGLAAIMAAKAAGCTTIIAVDIHNSRLQLATEMGATHTVNSRNTNASEEILGKILPGGTHYAFDTTGRNEVIGEAVAALRFMGKCILVAISSQPKLELSNATFNMGKSIEYVIEGDSVPDIFIPQLIALYKQGKFPFDRLITFYDLEDINRAVADSLSGETLKAVIRMPQ